MKDLKERARAHWKEFRPKLFRDLMKEKKLEAALDNAVERTLKEMAELQTMGYHENEAWGDCSRKLSVPPRRRQAARTRQSALETKRAFERVRLLTRRMKGESRTVDAIHHPIHTVERLKKALKGE